MAFARWRRVRPEVDVDLLPVMNLFVCLIPFLLLCAAVVYAAVARVISMWMSNTATTLVMLPFALALGIAAGYFSGWVDDVIQYLYTVLNSIPGVLLIAVGILMVTNYFTILATALQALTPEFLRSRI